MATSFGPCPFPTGVSVSIRVGVLVAIATPLAAQAAWTQHFPTPSPTARVMHSMVFDAEAGRILLFGGADGPGSVRWNDTWEYDGVSWFQKSVAVRPVPRGCHRMVYDSVRGRTVLFGGLTGWSTPLGDTWEWDGVTWQQRTSATAPTPRLGHAMAYDPVRQRTVLFGGGVSGSPFYFADTWEWDGSAWQSCQPAISPPGSDASAMAYDVARQRSVLFVPVTVNSTLIGAETWEWDGSSWAQRTPAHMPSPRRFPAVAYDAVRQRVVLFGGHHDPSNSFLSDMWEWDGSDWTDVSASPQPAGRGQSAMVFDGLRGTSVLFGGALGWGNHEAGDTWEYGVPTPATYTTFGVGCASSVGIPWLAAATSRPQLGQMLQIGLYDLPPDHSTLIGLGWSNSVWQGASLPQDLGVLGAPGCALRISPDLLWPLFNWGGRADWSLPIPADRIFLGLVFYNQAVAIDHANALGLVFTNAGAARIGDR